jgi:antitoxin CptB
MRHERDAMTERSSAGLDERRRKLLFRAWRRGVREMDLIVGRFADVHIDKFDAAGLDDFERLIEAGNTELYAWVTGTERAPAHYDTAVLAQLKAFHAGARTERAKEGR